MTDVLARRYRDALFITQGACNPMGVSRALHEACIEAHREGMDTKGVCNDPAVRLIAHQLAFLLNVKELDSDLTTYGKITDECQRHLTEQKRLEREQGIAEADQRKADSDAKKT